MHAARHEVVARALRRGLGEHRRFDRQEAMRVEVVLRRPLHLVAEAQVVVHARLPEVEVTVF